MDEFYYFFFNRLSTAIFRTNRFVCWIWCCKRDCWINRGINRHDTNDFVSCMWLGSDPDAQSTVSGRRFDLQYEGTVVYKVYAQQYDALFRRWLGHTARDLVRYVYGQLSTRHNGRRIVKWNYILTIPVV